MTRGGAAAVVVAAWLAGCGGSRPPAPAPAPTPAPARDPLDPALFEQLTDELEARFERALREHGGFVTFGGGITTTGELVYIMPEVGDLTDPKRDLARVLDQLAAERFAVGVVVVDTVVSPPDGSPRTDAVWIVAEARAGFIMQSFLPYTIAAPGQVTYGTAFTVPVASHLIFVARPGATPTSS